MAFLIYSFKIHFKRILINPVFICMLLFLTVMIFTCSFFLNSHKKIITVNIGILAEEPDYVTEKIFSLLINNRQLNFISFDNSQKDEMIQMIKNRKLECAYIFEKGLLENVKRENFDKIITLVKSPATVTSGIVNEAVFAAVINSAADILSAEITADMFGLEFIDIVSIFTLKIEDYHKNDIFLHPIFMYENIYDENVSNAFSVRIVHGILIILLFIFSFFLIPIFINDKKDGLYKMLNTKKILVYYLAQFLTSFLIMLILSFIALACLKITVSNALLPLSKELLGISIYIALIQSISLLCVLILKNSEPLYAGFIFALIIQVIFGNLFLDLHEISAAIGRFQILPSAYYMNFLLNSGSLIVPLILFLIFIILDVILAVTLNLKYYLK